MKRLAVVAALAAALLLPRAVPAQAGYRVQEVDPDFPAEVTTYWFQAGKVRVDGALEGLTVIVDTKAGEGWLIDASLRRYAGGKLEALAAELANLEAQEAAEDGAAGEEEAEGAPSPAEKPHSVEVRDLGPAEKILGYETRRHAVRVDGELVEELWIAPKLDIAAEVDPAAFAAAMRKMLGDGSAGQGYEDNPAYRAVRAAGFPLRQVLHFVGEKSALEVSAVANQVFPAADFAVPKGFARAGYAELLFGESE